MEIITKNIGVILLLTISIERTISVDDDKSQLNHWDHRAATALSRVKRQFGGYYDPYSTYRRRPVPIPIIIGGGGLYINGFGRPGFGRGFGGRGFGGKGFGGRGVGWDRPGRLRRRERWKGIRRSDLEREYGGIGSSRCKYIAWSK